MFNITGVDGNKSRVVNCHETLFVFPTPSSTYAYTFTLVSPLNGESGLINIFHPVIELIFVLIMLPPYAAWITPLLKAVVPSIFTIIL